MFVVHIVSILIWYSFYEFRYVLYFPFVISILTIVTSINSVISINKKHYYWLVFIVVTLFVSILGGYLSNFIKETALISMPIMTFVFIKKYKIENHINYEFVTNLYFIVLLISFINILIRGGTFDLIELFLNSNSLYESPIAPLFAILCVLSLHKKKTFYLTIATFVLTVLASKRIVTLALVFSLLFYYFAPYSKKRGYIQTIITLAIGVNCIIIFLYYLLGNGYFDLIIYELTGNIPQTFTAGRSVVYGIVFRELNSIFELLFGFGFGFTNYIITLNNFTIVHLHSDVLKIMLETGIVGFLFFTINVYKAPKNKLALTLIILLNIMYLTENYIIYYDVMFMSILAFLILNKDNSPKK